MEKVNLWREKGENEEKESIKGEISEKKKTKNNKKKTKQFKWEYRYRKEEEKEKKRTTKKWERTLYT